jgi:hypothetical protein
MQAVLLAVAVIQTLTDDTNETVAMNQAAQIFQNPHISILPVLFLVIYTLERPKYYTEFHKHFR